MSGGHLLVTGFGPFPGMPANPSGVLARRLGGMPRLKALTGGRLRVRVLTTAYAAIPEELEPALAEGPAAILMFGVSGRAKRVRVEARARNRASRLYPDASGRIARGLALDPNGPAERRAPAAATALAALRRNGVPAIPSQDAGRYLCNAAYYRALAGEMPVLFLHIPPVPRKPKRVGKGRAPRRARMDATAACCAVARLLLLRSRLPARCPRA